MKLYAQVKPLQVAASEDGTGWTQTPGLEIRRVQGNITIDSVQVVIDGDNPVLKIFGGGHVLFLPLTIQD